jgi:ADP-ribose pyrophosphatase
MASPFFSPPPIPYLNDDTLVYRGRRITVHSPLIRNKNGREIGYDIVKHPGAVVILPFVSKNEILMIDNHRPAVNQTLLELPAGTLEAGEAPIATAQRELVEETGYQAESMTPLLQFYSTPGFTNELLWGFKAEGLNFQGQQLDEGEEIKVVQISLREAVAMAKAGRIIDAKSLVILFYACL